MRTINTIFLISLFFIFSCGDESGEIDKNEDVFNSGPQLVSIYDEDGMYSTAFSYADNGLLKTIKLEFSSKDSIIVNLNYENNRISSISSKSIMYYAPKKFDIQYLENNQVSIEVMNNHSYIGADHFSILLTYNSNSELIQREFGSRYIEEGDVSTDVPIQKNDSYEWRDGNIVSINSENLYFNDITTSNFTYDDKVNPFSAFDPIIVSYLKFLTWDAFPLDYQYALSSNNVISEKHLGRVDTNVEYVYTQNDLPSIINYDGSEQIRLTLEYEN